jgi:hypothetical protein
MSIITGHTTRAIGTVLTAAIYNFDHVIHISNANNLNADKLESSSAQPASSELTAVAAIATTGIVRRTAPSTWTAGGGIQTAEIADDQVTYGKMQPASANTVLARAANTSGDIAEVALAANTLLGRGSSGDIAGITLGTNLSFSGGVLNATPGAGGVASFEGRTGVVVSANGDYTASEITNVAAGNIAAVTVQAALNELDTEKLAASSYTAADVLSKLLTVDGSGSGLDADTLDGISSAGFYQTGGTDVSVADGGTGRSSTVAYAPIVGGVTTTAAEQSVVSAGTAGQLLTSAGASAIPVYADNIATILYVFDGAGSALTTGVKGDLPIPFGCTILEWTILADQSGSIQFDIWKDTFGNYPPTIADTITASAKPLISAATKGQSSTLTGWTTAIAANDTLRYNIDSVTSITRATLALKVRKS